jgi:carbon monoxide dehydrogenase subunit G
MKLEFSGSPAIAAPRERVWERLMDPHFVAQSAPGVESVQAIDPTHFKVISGFGVGSIRVRFTMDVELYDIIDGRSAKMRVRGKAPGSAIDVVSNLQVDDEGSGGTQLKWSATSEVSGTVASVGARLMEGTARKLTEQFWTDFARRVSDEE